MAKGQQRSNREHKKPKKAKDAVVPASVPVPRTTVTFGKAGLNKPKR